MTLSLAAVPGGLPAGSWAAGLVVLNPWLEVWNSHFRRVIRAHRLARMGRGLARHEKRHSMMHKIMMARVFFDGRALSDFWRVRCNRHGAGPTRNLNARSCRTPRAPSCSCVPWVGAARARLIHGASMQAGDQPAPWLRALKQLDLGRRAAKSRV